MKLNLKIYTLIFLICFLFQNSYSQQDVNGWYWLNGQPTGNTLNWVKVINSFTLYAVGDRGTFMKSSDGGDTWSINSQVGAVDNSSTGGGATRVLNYGWFFDANTGIVAGQSLSTNPGVVSRTTDGGNTWTYIQYNSIGGTVNGLYFINSNTGFLCGGANARVHKTIDGGLTWTDITGDLNPTTTWNSIYAFDANNIIVSTSSNIIFRTANGGTTWFQTLLPGSPATITDVYFKDANTGYACGNGNYFAYTLNGGASWTQSNPPSTVGQRRLKYSAGSVYLVGAYTEIYKSTNDGVSWSAINFIDGSNVNQPTPFIMFGIDVLGLDIAVVGNAGIVNISNDGGSSWRNYNYAAIPDMSVYASVFALSPNGKIWVGSNLFTAPNPELLLYSANGGTSWTSQTTFHQYPIRGIEFVNSNVGFITGGRFQDFVGEFSNTIDGGNTWNFISLPVPANTHQMYALDFIDANTGWVVGGVPGIGGSFDILKTTDGGTSFAFQTLDVLVSAIAFAISMNDANNGYLLAGNGVYKTTNGGTNWNKNLNPFVTSTSWNYVYSLSKDVVFLCGNGTSNLKRVVKSVDGGQTWVDLTSNLLPDVGIGAMSWINLKHGVIGGVSGFSARTTDGGISWTQTNPGISTIRSLSLPDKNTLFETGQSGSDPKYAIMRKLENITSISVNVTMGIEGFWNGKPMVTDTVRVYLANSTSPFAIIDSAIEVVNINGYATYEFYNAAAGSYYIVLKQRNTLETWSKNPVAMAAGGNYNFDFSDVNPPLANEGGGNNAFCDNQILKAGKYCMVSGDVNQDGVVDIADLSLIDNDAYNFAEGYLPTDLDGNNIVDLSDMAIADNNAFDTRQVKSPITGCP